ncbi:hypothetical protein [Vibrio sp. CAU 1672]|uniref:hypothetical protein n=1 Tax=Vibrio sp. CAU 1672 TaxID=3032594 RepID=UPI0023DA11F3|nr:hypothetical protein [Vibrio sp. CAU 1672]MDF2152873.1 hypothetical protein [Vibrio sp. CAU 1672]
MASDADVDAVPDMSDPLSLYAQAGMGMNVLDLKGMMGDAASQATEMIERGRT